MVPTLKRVKLGGYMDNTLITNPLGILVVLVGSVSLFIFLERSLGLKLFNYFPSLIWIYVIPVIFSNIGVIPNESPVYEWLRSTILPVLLIIMLKDVDVVAAVRIMGKGIFVMLCGSAGVIIGAPITYLIVKRGLGPEIWKGFGALAGSWIGGSANMAAVSEGLKTSPADLGLAILGDNLVYMVWIPLLLASKIFTPLFNKFTKVDQKRIDMLDRSADDFVEDKGSIKMKHLLYLLFFGLTLTWLAGLLAPYIPQYKPILTQSSWKILLITTFGIILSTTPAKKIPGGPQLSMVFLLTFVASMGAKANIREFIGQAPWFVLGAYIWIAIHATFCILGARLFRVDLASTAIASAANIGGIASAPLIAACHNKKLVPVGVLMALIGYSIGTYGAFAAAWMCYMVSRI